MNEAKGRAERETREEAEALGLSQDNDPWQNRGQKARGTDMRSVGNKSMLQPLALDKNAKNCFFMSKAKWGKPWQKHPIMCIEFTSKHQYVGFVAPPHRPTAPPAHRPTAPPPHRPTGPPAHRPTASPLQRFTAPSPHRPTPPGSSQSIECLVRGLATH